ncbi:MAG: PaaI family thioesterase [Deltaproteobacteria bacterium]|nr:PaaI family thioesterase [Deltaproteobacteria bacterium]
MSIFGPDADKAAILERINRTFCSMVPHNESLGLTMTDYDEGAAVIRLPYSTRLVGNPDTGVLHGGAITALLDATCGAAVFMKLMSPIPIATLDLRIDYLKPATPSQDVFARAECFKLARNVAFARAIAYQTAGDPIATAAATFMISTPGKTAMAPIGGDGSKATDG